MGTIGPITFALPPAVASILEKKFGSNITQLAQAMGVDKSVLAGNLKGSHEMKLGTALAMIKTLELDDTEAIKVLKLVHKQRTKSK